MVGNLLVKSIFSLTIIVALSVKKEASVLNWNQRV